jgi:chromate transporter
MTAWQQFLWGPLGLGAAEIGAMFLHFLSLSLLSVGGALTTAPDMQRFIVGQRGWLSEGEFTASVALAQAAPGPNVLFVAVIGWNVAGMAGVLATLAGTLLPSSVLTLSAGRLVERKRNSRGQRAFNAGMAPLTLGLLMATAWVLLQPALAASPWPSVMAATATMALMLGTRASPLWPVAAGAVAGALGWIG